MPDPDSEHPRINEVKYGIENKIWGFEIRYRKTHLGVEYFEIEYSQSVPAPGKPDQIKWQEKRFYKNNKPYIVTLQQLEKILSPEAVNKLIAEENIPKEIRNNIQGL